MFRRDCRFAFAAFVALSVPATAQQVRGTVTDSASGRPLPGAVVMLLSASGSALRRAVTDDRGSYALSPDSAAERIRFVRIGFRPREFRITGALDERSASIALAAIPFLLETITTVGNPSCPRRNDSQSAFALWQQARSGLLATIVAREASPARVSLLVFEQLLAGATDNVTEQRVRPASGEWANAFGASFSAATFAANGFASWERGRRYFHGPDAEVLLDDKFQTSYCFSIADRQASRPNQVGLRFVPARQVAERIEIDGVLWIDTLARQMREIDFRYLGLNTAMNRFRPGGRVEFREMPNGVVLVDRWHIRMVESKVDTLVLLSDRREPGDWGGAGDNTRGRSFVVTRGGGEIARLQWADGTQWASPLGTLRLQLLDSDGAAAAGVTVRLDSTHYTGISGADGLVEIRDLLPGPYLVTVVDEALNVLGLHLNKPAKFTAVRDSVVVARLRVVSEANVVRESCRNVARGSEPILLLARVVTVDSKPLQRALWRVGSQNGVTKADGIISACLREQPGATVALEVAYDEPNRGRTWRKTHPLVLKTSLTVVRVELP